MMKYEIRRTAGKVEAFLVSTHGARETMRDPVIHRVHHSPDGYEYGYSGSGPSDLARSIMWDYFGRYVEPVVYLAFRDHFIANLNPDENFHVIETSEIHTWLDNTFGEDEA